MPKRLTKLTDAQAAKMPAWAEKWIAIGLRTGAADRERFESAAADCYRFADLEPVPTVWVSSPIVGALAAPIAASAIALHRGVPVDSAVDSALGSAVDSALGSAVDSAVRSADLMWWHYWIGGQLWVGYWYAYGPAGVSFLIDVCDLELPDDIEARARAYAATAESACYWWPNRDFIMASERPSHIHLDDAGRLHSETGTAIGWPDGWGVYSWHGVVVPPEIIEAPSSITASAISEQPNAEVRRVMLDRFGTDRYLSESGAQLLSTDEYGKLWKIGAPTPDDEPLVVVQVVNSSPEPDGSFKDYFLSVPPTMRTAREAVAWTFGVEPEDYEPVVQT